VSDRPRLIFNPSDNLCGFLTYIQYYIFKDIKWVWNSFSHGDNSKSLEDRIRNAINGFVDPVSVSFDGSSFDSNQHHQNINVVDC